MKVENSFQINPFGGINFIHKSFDDLKIDKILEEHLPNLPNQCFYDWKDILYSFWSIYFCGGDCIEDINHNLKSHLQNNKFFKVPSPDRIIDRFKMLSKSSELLKSPRGVATHQFSINENLNELMIKISKQASLLDEKNKILDYDNTIIATEKSDSKKTYIKRYGYQPGVAFINGQVVYVENRNGNSDAQTLQDKTLERMFELLTKQSIKINQFRADGASYCLSTLRLLEQKADKFYVRAARSGAIGKLITEVTDWKEVEISGTKALRAEVKYKPFTGNTAKRHGIKDEELSTYRYVITKVEKKDGQLDVFTKEAFLYRLIVTNDFEMSADQVVEFYNQRGNVERQFDILKNDFGWKNLAFSKLEENTVFLIFTSICKNLYDFIITKFSKIYSNLNVKFRIKKFIFRFICIPARWIKQSRQYKLKVFGKLNYKT